MTNETTLGKALPIKYGKARTESFGYATESVPVYGSSGVIGKFDRALTIGPTLIVGRKGSAGSVHYSATPCWPIDTVYYAETPANSTLHYFKYLLEHLRLGQHDKSTAIPSLGRDDYNAVPVSVPSLAEQERVVAYLDEQLSRLDASVAALHRVQANLKRYRASVLKSACEGRLVPTEAELAHQEGRAFETGAELLNRVLAERRADWSGKGKWVDPDSPTTPDLPVLPEGWVWASAAEACAPVVDCHNKTAPYTDSGIPLIRTTNIRDGQLLLDGVRFVDEPTYEFWSRRCPPHPGDVLFTREAPMGEAAIIPDGLKVCLGQRTMLMRPSAAISASYLLSALTSPVVQRLIQTNAVGSGVKHLRVGDVERLPIPLPPLAEQHRIVAEADRRLSLIRVAEAQVAANLARAQRLRQSILQAAFATPA
jgi:type I restriction enzyme S subunit